MSRKDEKAISFRLSTEVYEKLQEKAEKNLSSVCGYVRLLIGKELNKG